jgi:transposase-like protein
MDVSQVRVRAVQRFLCMSCDKSFTASARERHRSYSEAFMVDVTCRHIEGQSYRVIARDVYRQRHRKISPTSVQQMVAAVASQVQPAWVMSKELKPHWSGFLVVDEKRVPVRGGELWCYVAVDTTGDVVHWCPVAECSVTEATRFLEEVQSLGYLCRGITSDLDSALTLAISRIYAKTPHQYCVKHALSVVEKILGYRLTQQRQRRRAGELRTDFERLALRKGLYLVKASQEFVDRWRTTRVVSKKAREIASLREQCQHILCAQSQKQALDLLACLRRHRSSERQRKWKAVAFLERHWVRLMRHHNVRGLPRTNNMAETFNRQVKRRIKTIESFQHRENAIAYMNLLVAYLRLKPYTDCRHHRKCLNGKSRLQAAGVRIHPKQWLKACLENRPFSATVN